MRARAKFTCGCARITGRSSGRIATATIFNATIAVVEKKAAAVQRCSIDNGISLRRNDSIKLEQHFAHFLSHF
jgi:hypothetical protein